MADDGTIRSGLEAALRAERLRQSAIANNIANMNTPGYRRLDVSFEDLLNRALASEDPAEIRNLTAELFQPRNTPVDSRGNDVTLDNEVGEMVKNSLRYQTLIRLLRKKYSQIELAINSRY